MLLLKKILVVSFCALVFSTSGEAKENTVTMRNLDDLNHEAILLEKELEILKKRVAIKQMRNELKDASSEGAKPSPLTAAPPLINQTPVPVPQNKPEPASPTPSVKKANPDKFSSNEVASMPRVKSVYGFGEKKQAVLTFSDESTANVQEGGNFRIGSKKYMVSEIQSSGVIVKKNKKGESLTLRFIPARKKDGKSSGKRPGPGFMSPMTFPPAPEFLDSTSNKYED